MTHDDTMKSHSKWRMLPFAITLGLLPVLAGYGLAEDWHSGHWGLAMGLGGLVSFAMAVLAVSE